MGRRNSSRAYLRPPGRYPSPVSPAVHGEPGANAPALSVLLLSHDYARFLGASLASVLAQSFDSFEVIVLDDGSTDDSLEVAAGFACDPRVRIVAHDRNEGFVATLIEGTGTLSRGEFLVMVSADDVVLDPRAFAAQVARLRDEPRAVACMTAFRKIVPGGDGEIRRLLPGNRTITGAEFARRVLTEREFSVMHSGTVIRASAYHAAGGYRRDLSNYGDFALWLALARIGPVAVIDRPCYGYRLHEAQMSGKPERRRAVLREGLAVLRAEAVTARAAGLPISDARALRTRGADLALADAFAGRRTVALLRCGDLLALAPGIAVTSGGWWLAAGRALLGERAWRALAAVRRRFR